MPGSSATATTSPPCAPTSAEFTNGSAATLSPTCFIETSARRPAKQAPSASSYAVFSLAHQAANGRPCLRRCSSRYSRISVAGVPG